MRASYVRTIDGSTIKDGDLMVCGFCKENIVGFNLSDEYLTGVPI